MACIAVTCHVFLVAWVACCDAPVIDEVGHLTAGVSHWTFGRFDLYRVNPPLVRMVATLPVYLMGPEFDWSRYDPTPGRRSEFSICDQFLEAEGTAAFWYFR